MSTENNTPVESNNDDLDVFAAEFFGQNKANSEQASEEDIKPEDSESDALEDDTHVAEDDTLAPDDDDVTDDADEEVEPAPKPKKNRFQERIDEVVGKQREAERRAEDLERRLNEVLQKQNTKDEPVAKTVVDDNSPKPTDTNKDGSEKYPLGEFDPSYIKDLMKYTLDEESRIRRENETREAEQRAKEEAQAELQTSWNERLVPAKERYPDFQEKGQQMLSTFEGIDEAYGEYLTTTIMEMEYGPDVFYYLASNLDEAEKIVNSGAKKATIALGRLEAKFASAAEEKPTRPRVSNAAPPPPQNKGSETARPAIKGDEKDLDAFAREFFKGRR